MPEDTGDAVEDIAALLYFTNEEEEGSHKVPDDLMEIFIFCEIHEITPEQFKEAVG